MVASPPEISSSAPVSTSRASSTAMANCVFSIMPRRLSCGSVNSLTSVKAGSAG